MAAIFYGNWSLRILTKMADFDQRVVIVGSANSDGPVGGIPGHFIEEIKGERWSAELEWSSDGGATWQPSVVRRTMLVTASEGLIVLLAADDNTEGNRDQDFDDLVVQFTYLDPAANPKTPTAPFDFTVPPEWVVGGTE